MSIEYQIDPKDGYLYAEVWGTFDLDQAKEMYPRIFDAIHEHAESKICIDFRRLEGDISILARYELGVLMAKVKAKSQPIQIACIGTKKQVLRDKFLEMVAINRGVNIKIATDIEEALQWLGVKDNDNTH